MTTWKKLVGLSIVSGHFCDTDLTGQCHNIFYYVYYVIATFHFYVSIALGRTWDLGQKIIGSVEKECKEKTTANNLTEKGNKRRKTWKEKRGKSNWRSTKV